MNNVLICELLAVNVIKEMTFYVNSRKLPRPCMELASVLLMNDDLGTHLWAMS